MGESQKNKQEFSDVKTQLINLENGKAFGIIIAMPVAPIVLIKARQGYVMCGYLNMATANKLGDIAGKVSGVKTFEDVLNANIVEVSEKAKTMGLSEGMNARMFLNKLM
ncbi:MAG: DUF1805 domain-containing protein [Euryarchaeota archaeon]|nr:DUF1805 domain-containing protein [Euryarchaeota archaeon]